METLDLHGVRHNQVDRLTENFILLNSLPVKIITGNSCAMKSAVTDVVERNNFSWDYESFKNIGAIIVTLS